MIAEGDGEGMDSEENRSARKHKRRHQDQNSIKHGMGKIRSEFACIKNVNS